jgi:hypothetical protein
MGMLFNTPATLQILKTVSTVFNQSGLKRIRSEGGWDARFNGLPGANGTYSTVAAPLGVDHDDTTMSGNWQTWLTDYFDINTTNLDKYKIVAAFVGERIASAITDNSNCLQVEFFGSSLKGVGKSEFGGGSAIAPGGSRLT